MSYNCLQDLLASVSSQEQSLVCEKVRTNNNSGVCSEESKEISAVDCTLPEVTIGLSMAAVSDTMSGSG